MTDQLAKEYLPKEVESKWYDFWIKGNYFHADENSDKPPYCIVIPPPNVTGKLHMGHALFITIQDLLIRFKRMQGFETLWLPGTDHAGIATQVMVERQIAEEGLTRQEIGREEFLQRVWKWKEEKGGHIIDQLKVMGASCDWERERFTLDSGLSEAVRVIFKKLHDDGLIYRAERLVNWDPGSQTVLSDLEVEQETEQGFLWHIAYPIVGSDERIVIATTRPETMLGDTAVAVHPEDERYAHLVGKYLQLPLCDRQIIVIADEMVDPEFGSGALKITPAHSFHDFEAGERHGLELIQVIGLDTKITDAAPEAYRGLTREVAREKLIEDLDAAGFLVKIEPRQFMPGRSQRSGVIVEPLPLTQWWVKTESLAKPAIEAIETGKTKIVPAFWEKTYFHWMRNLRDWCISRQLWWGHQIPAWYDRNDPHVHAQEDGTFDIGAKAVPHVSVNKPVLDGVDPDDLIQDPDVLDTWFSSGLWPFSTLGWPNDTATLKKFYPTNVLETGSDILFFWVARMMMMGLYAMDQVPFDTIYLHAMLLGADGKKMSKTTGNVVNPLHVIYGVEPSTLDEKERESCRQLFEKNPNGIKAQGADALRFTLAVFAAQGRNIVLELERIEGYRAFLNKLWQASRFVMMTLKDSNTRAEGCVSSDEQAPWPVDELSLPECWILNRLQQVIESVTKGFDEYRFNDSAQSIYNFVWSEFCDWYIEFAKPILYDGTPEALALTQRVLLHVLESTLRLLHPIAPYVTEEIWQALPKHPSSPESICVASWPVVDEPLRFPKRSAAAQRLIEMIQALRNLRGEGGIKPSKRIPKLIVFTQDEEARKTIEEGSIHIKRLAKIDLIEFADAETVRPTASATTMSGSVEFVVPFAGLIDVEEERGRINKALAKIEKEMALVIRKLNNPKFVARAPEAVVAKERAKFEAFEAERAQHAASLLRLEELSA